jgi:hypothetical protein
MATLPWLWKSASFGTTVLVFDVAVALLSVLWFHGSWEYGYEFQGPQHTRVVALENVLVLSMALALAIAGRARRSQVVVASSYLVLFASLAWCAFPYLGEAP